MIKIKIDLYNNVWFELENFIINQYSIYGIFIMPIISQIVWFSFIHRNHISIHLKIIQIAWHQGIPSFIFIIQRMRKIFCETSIMVIKLLENASKMVSSIDLIPKKMIELKNDILAQKNKNRLLPKGPIFNMTWNAQD